MLNENEVRSSQGNKNEEIFERSSRNLPNSERVSLKSVWDKIESFKFLPFSYL